MYVYLVCYDISDDKQRRSVSRLLEQEGLRVQHSVFEISFKTSSELKALKDVLKPLIEGEDDIRFYHLCAACRKKSLTVEDKAIARFPLAVVI
ncbi:MAG: CRISPR-associated endonuclease Cas2 [Thiotrichaceae bacterium]|nr:CRISPR-associated endonuclease Cas2 [Thiotrichaceae bacterium]